MPGQAERSGSIRFHPRWSCHSWSSMTHIFWHLLNAQALLGTFTQPQSIIVLFCHQTVRRCQWTMKWKCLYLGFQLKPLCVKLLSVDRCAVLVPMQKASPPLHCLLQFSNVFHTSLAFKLSVIRIALPYKTINCLGIGKEWAVTLVKWQDTVHSKLTQYAQVCIPVQTALDSRVNKTPENKTKRCARSIFIESHLHSFDKTGKASSWTRNLFYRVLENLKQIQAWPLWKRDQRPSISFALKLARLRSTSKICKSLGPCGIKCKRCLVLAIALLPHTWITVAPPTCTCTVHTRSHFCVGLLRI